MVDFEHYCIYEADGEIVGYGTCTRGMSAAVARAPGQAVHAGDDGPWLPGTHRVVNGAPVPYTDEQRARKAERPQWRGRWDNAAMTWADRRPLAELKEAQREQVRAWHAEANKSFSHAGKTFAADEDALQEIEAVQARVVRRGALPNAFGGTWQARDGSELVIATKQAWDAFYDALQDQRADAALHARELRAAIKAAQSREQVLAVVWAL